MRIAFVARKGNITISKGQVGLRGYSVQRLTSVLYQKLIEHKSKDMIIDLVELGTGNSTFIRRATSFATLAYNDLNKYDIIHAPTPLPMRPLRMGKDTKLITTSHGIRSIDPKSPCYQLEHNLDIKNSIIDSFGARQTISSDFVIAVSSLTKKRVVDLGFDSNKVFVVNNGLDERFMASPLNKPENRKKRMFTVGYLGPFYPNKNVIFAIRAFRKLEDKKINFEIWGKKTYEYKAMLKAAEGDDRIKFMGVAPERELVSVYDRFDAFVYPTICDQFPGSVMEAQSRGVPVISYKYGEMSMESRRYCFEAEDEEHMATIINEIKRKGIANKRISELMRYARSFTSDRQAIETLDVYRKVYKS